jgi:hypothetical protein
MGEDSRLNCFSWGVLRCLFLKIAGGKLQQQLVNIKGVKSACMASLRVYQGILTCNTATRQLRLQCKCVRYPGGCRVIRFYLLFNSSDKIYFMLIW